jgi:hypothetical protein
MEQESIVQQTKVEREATELVTLALERTLLWTVKGDDFSRKLSSVRFVTESFQHHLERLFALEELDGYMNVVCQLHPEFTDKVKDLKATHAQLHEMTRQLVLNLEQASPTDVTKFEVICEELKSLISSLREHNKQENELLVEAVFRDTGGQG